MKKTVAFIMALLFVVVCMFPLGTEVFAKDEIIPEAVLVKSVKTFPSKAIAEPVFDIDTLIKEKLTESVIEEIKDSSFWQWPENLEYDSSVYLVEYFLVDEYWSLVKTFDYEGLIEPIYTEYPNIYVPVFADVAGASKGEIQNRVIGYFLLRFDPMKNDYSVQMGSYYPNSKSTPRYISRFTNSSYLGTYEAISYYLAQNEIKTEQVFLLKHGNSLNHGDETVAVVKTNTDTFILDFSDSLQQESKNDISEKVAAYSVSEYRTLRMKLENEKGLYQTVSGWENVRYGGNVDGQQDNHKNTWNNITYILVAIPLALVIVAVFAIVVWLLVEKRRKRS